MANLQCNVREPGCIKNALVVCHHCGRPVCKNCDKVMTDRQFARSHRSKGHPKAHHCPDCYHAHWFVAWLSRIWQTLGFPNSSTGE